jgi:hypothetical protein
MSALFWTIVCLLLPLFRHRVYSFFEKNPKCKGVFHLSSNIPLNQAAHTSGEKGTMARRESWGVGIRRWGSRGWGTECKNDEKERATEEFIAPSSWYENEHFCSLAPLWFTALLELFGDPLFTNVFSCMPRGIEKRGCAAFPRGKHARSRVRGYVDGESIREIFVRFIAVLKKINWSGERGSRFS